MRKLILIFALALIAGLGGVAYFIAFSSHNTSETVQTKKNSRVATSRKSRAAGRLAVRDGRKKSDGTPISVSEPKAKPKLTLDAEDERKLTEVQRQLLAEIVAASDRDDIKALIKVVQKMQASVEWPDGIPASIKTAAIEALKWFGVEGLPEIAGFLADGTQEMQEAVGDAFEEALFDADGDYAISEIVKTAALALNDFEVMDSILMAAMMEMRPSVAVDTVKFVLTNGQPESQKAMVENMEIVFGDDEIRTMEDIDSWYADPEHQDDEFSEEMYGPSVD